MEKYLRKRRSFFQPYQKSKYHGNGLYVGQEVRRYGHYRCPFCKKQWESGQTICTYQGMKNGEKDFKVNIEC